MTRKDIRTVIASSVMGATVEWYDFFLYGVAAGIIFNEQYFPSDDRLVGTLLAYATFAVGFVARPVGGLLFGHIGDRHGRKKTLVATMIIMGTATFLIGAIPTYAQIGIWAPILLVVLRVAQGIAIGGEWGGAVLMATEYAPDKRRGLYGSFPQMGLALGLLLGTGIFALLSTIMSDAAFESYGWRIAFFLSIILVGIGMFVRLKVLETPAFTSVKELEQEAKVPMVELLKEPRARRHLFLGLGSRWAEGVAFNTWAVFIIAYGTGTLEVRRIDMLLAVMLSAFVMLFFIPLFGHLSDRLGRREVFAAGAIAFGVVVYPAFLIFETGSVAAITVTLVITLGVLYPMMYGPQAALYTEMFPTAVRYSGISFVYQFSGIYASGLTPLVLTALLGRADGRPWLVGGYVVLVAIVSAAATMAIRRKDIYRDHVEVVVTPDDAAAAYDPAPGVAGSRTRSRAGSR